MLNNDDIALLEKPFELAEHSFRDGKTSDDGKPYIQRSAIVNRLNAIDRGWRISVNLRDIQIINDVVAISGTLTIKGVEQQNVSTAIIQRFNKEGELSPYMIAQNTAHAIKTATSGLLQRCLQTFGCGLYLKSQPFKGISTRAALKIALDKLNTLPHWALNGGGVRIDVKMKSLDLKWAVVAIKVESGKVLNKLSDTTLTEAEFSARLDVIAEHAKKKDEPTTNGDSL